MTAQAALRRDLRIATQHVAPIRKQFRRERDRLAANPDKDPVRDAEWEIVLAGLWADTGDQVYAKTVKTLDAEVSPGKTPTFPLFVAAAAAGLAKTSRSRIAAARGVKVPNLSRHPSANSTKPSSSRNGLSVSRSTKRYAGLPPSNIPLPK